MAEKIIRGGGNVLADLGLDETEQAKADLAIQIDQTITKRGLTQSRAAVLLGITQPQVSNIRNGHIDGFTIERLARILVRLDRDVIIQVKRARPRRRVPARLVVHAA